MVRKRRRLVSKKEHEDAEEDFTEQLLQNIRSFDLELFISAVIMSGHQVHTQMSLDILEQTDSPTPCGLSVVVCDALNWKGQIHLQEGLQLKAALRSIPPESYH